MLEEKVYTSQMVLNWMIIWIVIDSLKCQYINTHLLTIFNKGDFLVSGILFIEWVNAENGYDRSLWMLYML